MGGRDVPLLKGMPMIWLPRFPTGGTRMKAALSSAAALSLALGLSACGDAARSDADKSEAVSTSLPKGWSRLAGQDVARLENPGVQRLPVAARGDDGVTVEIRDTSRTIAGGDDIIEMFDALGRSSDIFAAPKESATETGRGARHRYLLNRATGAEGVLSLKGTVFFGNSSQRHSRLSAQLRAAGTPAIVIDSGQPAPARIRRIAAAIGLADAGEQLARKVEAQYAQAAAIAKTVSRKPRVIQLSATGAGGHPAVLGVGAPSSRLIAIAGGTDIGTEIGVKGASPLSPEGMVHAGPEVIVMTETDLKTFGGEEGLLKSYPTLAQTPAIIDGRVFIMPDLQLKTGGIASGAGVVALARAFAALDFE